ncbi:hypothetical protein QTJ16_005973 [Diplocarpon rosae]|uniref:Uncharacterized protein n=1 Tax=Diplocarpon rosae TaxID=946125 RepID=A0AAD9WAZ9_9HELO|nr:hypothetical protein QTJ16_005973 [Diplocarpon rosae]PBP25398.1 hypothetical protein BUE80_DR003818 [Diplocarpon rosae]
MCIINVYVDRFPDGKETAFRQTAFCQYGRPGQPCQKLLTLENPVRTIQFGEPTTEYIMTTHRRTFPHTPPRSPGGSRHRYSGDYSSEDGRLHRRQSTQRRSELSPRRPIRTHRRERIIIVDSPPVPRTPPPTSRAFTAPSSPTFSPYIIEDASPRERGRPVIVDERPLHRHPRVPSIGATVSERPATRCARSQSLAMDGKPNRRASVQWESPSTSHTSFDLRGRREAEAEATAAAEELERERRREQRIREQDEEIRRRPAVPIPPLPLKDRQYLRPVMDHGPALQDRMSRLKMRDERLLAEEREIFGESEMRRRLEDRDRIARWALAEREEEEMKRRLRERQMPKRRFSVGPGSRRHIVLYDDGVYRWE